MKITSIGKDTQIVTAGADINRIQGLEWNGDHNYINGGTNRNLGLVNGSQHKQSTMDGTEWQLHWMADPC